MAAVTYGRADLTWQAVELDPPGPGEVLVKLTASGICDTDRRVIDGTRHFALPGVVGHEGSGIVQEVGPGVSYLHPGEHVVLGWARCGDCPACTARATSYCEQTRRATEAGVRVGGPLSGQGAYRFLDGKQLGGHFFGQSSLASHTIVAASSLVAVDHRLPLAKIAPLGCGFSTAFHAVDDVIEPQPGTNVVVLGVGSVGSAAIIAASMAGAHVVAVDRKPAKLQLAAQLGADPLMIEDPAELPELLRSQLGHRPAAVVECTGNPQLAEAAIAAVGSRGVCVLIGGSRAGTTISLDHNRLVWGKRVQGVLGAGDINRTIGRLADLCRDGSFPLDKLVKVYPSDYLSQALADQSAGLVIKPVVLAPAAPAALDKP
ncbi:alcohol dehydrogenase catalytic domain-containing protein [Propionibacterium australiense]|nr:alcohol dehydrogenase catalytic domain-containing protein [Propionibacterium australiense]